MTRVRAWATVNAGLAKLWQELKRRRVVRVAVGYGAVAFAALQVIPVIQQTLRLPPWVTTLCVVVSLLGFPVAMALAWIHQVHATRSRTWTLVAAPAIVVGAAALSMRLAFDLESDATSGASAAASASAAAAARTAASAAAIASAGPAASTSASPRATTVTDLPVPASSSAAALSEYVAGVQGLRDNSAELAVPHFEKAVELDPTMALAHLRLAALYIAGDATRKRAEFAKAASLRGQLTERDRVFLEALEPVLQRARPDFKETLARLDRASERFPTDTELIDWAAFLRAGNPARAVEDADRALALDPSDAWAWQSKGDAAATLGRVDDARAALEHCVSLNVRSTDCLFDLAHLTMLEGQCEELGGVGRRVMDRGVETGAEVLAASLLALGRPMPEIVELLANQDAEAPPERRARLEASHRLAFALVAGDFATAEALAREEARAVEASPITRTAFDPRLGAALQLAEILVESGRGDAARAVAADFVARSDAWTKSTGLTGLDEAMHLARFAVGPGGISEVDLERQRQAWIDERLTVSSSHPGLVWTYAYAQAVVTEEDGRSALGALARFRPLTSFEQLWVIAPPDGCVGHAYLVAGRPTEALPHLKRAAASCSELQSTLPHVRAVLEYGLALEATGDKPGACAAYRRVLDRWGKAKPRSATAERAREHMRTLACAAGS